MENRGNLTLLLWLVIIVSAVVLGCRWWVVAQRVPLNAGSIQAAVYSEPAESGAVDSSPAQPAGARPEPGLDINVATAAQLEELPGIGRVLAGRIIDYRNQNGPFADTRELLEVNGIGEKTWQRIAGLVRVHYGKNEAAGD